MKIPFLDLKAQYQSISDDINNKVLDLFSSQNFILGSEVAELEKDLAVYSGTRFAVGVSSGSDALIVSLMALGVKSGDAVLTTPFTFFATVGAIARLGARVVFCDIDRTTFNMSPESFEQVLKKEMKGQKKNPNQSHHSHSSIRPMCRYGSDNGAGSKTSDSCSGGCGPICRVRISFFFWSEKSLWNG